MRNPVILAVATSCLGCHVRAQLPPTRPDATAIVAGIGQQGNTGGWADYADFSGCPQDDPVGTEVLDLIAGSTQAEGIVASLARLWSDEYDTCFYGPLDAWFLGSLTALVDQESVLLTLAVSDLPASLRPELDTHLRGLVADPLNPAQSRTEMANVVMDRLSPVERESAYLQFLASPGLPGAWVSDWSGFFTQEFGAAYAGRLGTVAASIDDETLTAAIGTVLTGTRLGSLPANDPQLIALGQAIQGRPAMNGISDALELAIAAAISVSVSAREDTYLKQGAPNKNQGVEDVLRIRQSGKNRALVRIDDSDFSAVATPIVSARLEFDIVFNANNWGTEGRTIDAHRMLVPWTHFGSTWRCADDADTSDSGPDCDTSSWEMQSLSPTPFELAPSGTLLVTKDLLGTVSIDVTADVQAMLDGGVVNYGWIIKKTSEGQAGHIQIGSSETGAGPRLVIGLAN